jgi:hypothetical protein
MDMLNIYNVGRGSFGGSGTEWFNSDPNMQNAMDDYDTSYAGGLTELQWLITNAIQRGNLPANNNGSSLYVVYLPPGEQVLAPFGAWNTDPSQGFGGYHDAFSYNGSTIYYAVIVCPGGSNPYEGNLGMGGSLTAVTSHELAEAVTDPAGGIGHPGWYDRSNNGEIGDVADYLGAYYTQWDGYYVQPIVNQNDQLMTIPAMSPSPPPAPTPPPSPPPAPTPPTPAADPFQEAAADAEAVIQGLERGNLGEAYSGLMDFESVLAQSPGLESELVSAFINDLYADI